MFLRSRSKEVVAAGRMVLIILGREGPDHVDRGMSFTWEILARAIADLVGQVKNYFKKTHICSVSKKKKKHTSVF